MNLMVLDTETGGLDPERYSCFSVGFLVMDLEEDDNLLQTYEEKVRLRDISDYIYTDEALELIKLTPAECLKEGKTIEEIQEDFMAAWHLHKCSLLAGHNVAYDIDVMACQIFKTSPQKFRKMLHFPTIIDSLSLLRLLGDHDKLKGSKSLSNMAKKMGITIKKSGNFHAALFDAMVTAKVISHLRKSMMEISL